MDNNATQDFTQGLIYQGSRGPVDVGTMVVTYAVRAFDKLLREHGLSVLNTPLVRAIARRAQLEGSTATGVHAVSGDKRMLRGSGGQFVGSYVPRQSS
jgi:hypothetical protein